MFRRAKDDDGSSSTSKSSKAPRLAGSKEAEEFDQEFTKIEKATNVNALKSPLKNILYRLNKMDDRFDEIDGRFDEIDDRFDSVDNRFDSLDNRLDKVFGVHKEKDATNVQWEEMCYHQLQQKFRERSFERNEYLTIGSGAYKMQREFDIVSNGDDEGNNPIIGECTICISLVKLEICKTQRDFYSRAKGVPEENIKFLLIGLRMISEERDKIQKAAKEANIEIILGKDWAKWQNL